MVMTYLADQLSLNIVCRIDVAIKFDSEEVLEDVNIVFVDDLLDFLLRPNVESAL